MWRMIPTLCLIVLMFVPVLTVQYESNVRVFAQTYDNDPAEKAANDSFKTVCYFPLPMEVNVTTKGIPVGLNTKLCSHLIFIPTIIVNNKVAFRSPTHEQMFLKAIPAMRQENPKLVILISNGGAINSVMQSMKNTSEYADSSIVFLRNYGLDGIDLDWEYPTHAQFSNFSRVFKEMRTAFEEEARQTKKPRLLLTAAVNCEVSYAKTIYDFAAVSKSVDFVNLMGYDFHGPGHGIFRTGYNSPLPELAEGANFWATKIGKDKVVVGFPFYCHAFKLMFSWMHDLDALADGRGECEGGTYTCACNEINNKNATVVFDGYNKVPYCYYGNQWTSFENVDSITIKTKWILDKGFPGLMVFHMLSDDVNGVCDGRTKYPLMNAILQTIYLHGNTER